MLFLSDIFPTGYMAAENCEIEPGDTVAVWGCGPVAQFAIQSAWMFGAGRVIAIDRVPERLAMAEKHGKAETINFDKDEVYDQLMEMTKGRGPDRCIDAVGAEAHGRAPSTPCSTRPRPPCCLATDRAHVLREAIMCCRKGGTISVPGVYIGFPDKIPFGAAMNKGLTFKMGQTHVQRYYEIAAREDRGRRDRPLLRDHSPHSGSRKRRRCTKPSATSRTACIKVVLKP